MSIKNFIKFSIFLVLFLTLIFSSYAATSHRVQADQSKEICEHGTCVRVTNTNPNEIFIPTKTAAEWDSFRNNLPTGASSCDYTNSISYSTWGACSVSCGGGTQTRTYTNDCGDSLVDTRACNTQSCCDPNIMVSCSWGSCSTTCGSGTQSGTCTNQCGDSVPQTQACTDTSGQSVVASCPSYGTCPTTCGTVTQSRTCTSVCGTSITQNQQCTNNDGFSTVASCPSYGTCPNTCGVTVTQSRTCTSVCGTSIPQSQACTDTSSVNQVSSCTGFGSCSASCGWGTQTQTCYYVCGGSFQNSQSCDAGSCTTYNVRYWNGAEWSGSISSGSTSPYGPNCGPGNSDCGYCEVSGGSYRAVYDDTCNPGNIVYGGWVSSGVSAANECGFSTICSDGAIPESPSTYHVRYWNGADWTGTIASGDVSSAGPNNCGYGNPDCGYCEVSGGSYRAVYNDACDPGNEVTGSWVSSGVSAANECGFSTTCERV